MEARVWRKPIRVSAITLGWLLALVIVCTVYAKTRWQEKVKRGREQYVSGDYEKALSYFGEGLRGARGIFGSKRMVAVTLSNIGETYRMQGNVVQAKRALSEAVELWIRMNEDDGELVAATYNNLGSVLVSEGEYGSGEVYLTRAINIWKSQGGASHEQLVTLCNLGELERDRGRSEAAGRYLREALDLIALNPSVGSRALGVCLNNYGLTFMDEGRFAEAQSYMERALEALKTTLGESHVKVGVCLGNLGRLAVERGDYRQARDYYHKSLAVRRLHAGDSDPGIIAIEERIMELETYAGKSESNSQ